ncbi:MAG: hypothetical protein IKD36_01545 [Clostridia bacterium]|nr:hypothetical protein [Clostridia bacterium]
MRELLKTNIYDVDETIIIVGSCLERMQPKAFEKLEKISQNIYQVCLEETHINMAITKIGGMIRTGKIKNIIFASVDKSPHCVQLHYIASELEKMMDLDFISIKNYVAVDDNLVEIDKNVISLSKNLSKIAKNLKG